MLIACIVPLSLLFVLYFFFDVRSALLSWAALLICIGSHFWCMKHMHSDSQGHDRNDDTNKKGDSQ